MTTERMLMWLLGLIASAGLMVGGAAFKFAFDGARSQATTALELAYVKESLATLSEASEIDQRQSEVQTMHWRYLSALKKEINALRFAAGLPPMDEPNLTD